MAYWSTHLNNIISEGITIHQRVKNFHNDFKVLSDRLRCIHHSLCPNFLSALFEKNVANLIVA